MFPNHQPSQPGQRHFRSTVLSFTDSCREQEEVGSKRDSPHSHFHSTVHTALLLFFPWSASALRSPAPLFSAEIPLKCLVFHRFLQVVIKLQVKSSGLTCNHFWIAELLRSLIIPGAETDVCPGSPTQDSSQGSYLGKPTRFRMCHDPLAFHFSLSKQQIITARVRPPLI